MVTHCPRRVLCPPGTGTESPGFNYSSEHVDAPEFTSIYFPPVPGYGFYTACKGLCTSIISQQDADLCAQRLAALCIASGGGGGPAPPGTPSKPTYGNTPQVCTEPGTGRIVFVPADVFIAESQAEANAMALAYANRAQKDPATPPGVTTVPPPTTITPTPGVNPIPGPVPQPPPHPPPAPPTSQCKPCDDTVGVDTFAIVGGVPVGTINQTWETAPLKCGSWKIEVTGGPFDPGATQAFISMGLFASDPARTPISWSDFFDCPQPAWISPCGSDVDCAAADIQKFGLTGALPSCCSMTEVTCKYAGCSQLEIGNFLAVMQIYYVCLTSNPSEPAKNFTVQGTWLGPLPP